MVAPPRSARYFWAFARLLRAFPRHFGAFARYFPSAWAPRNHLANAPKCLANAPKCLANQVGRRQSIGSAPCSASRALTRLNGREPKNPFRADNGEGCALATIGVSPSIGVSDCASRPHSTATSGPPRATSASIAAWVHTDVCGWTLAGMVDDDCYDRLVATASAELDRFTDGAGRVRFDAPAVIVTGRRR